MFMSFAGMLIQRLEQAARFVNSIFMNVPRLEEFFGVLDTTISVKERKNAVTLEEGARRGRLRRRHLLL